MATPHADLAATDQTFEPLEPRSLLSAELHNAPFPIDSAASVVPIAPVSALPSHNLVNLTAARGDVRFAGMTGRGTSVVVLDTGINRTHPFFGPDGDGNGIADRIVYQYDFADNDADASDRNGHGSNVSSIIASQDAVYRGIAPEAGIIHLKVFTDAGAGTFGVVERALQWVLANVSTYNIVAVNMSLGDSGNWNTPQSRYGLGDEIAALAGSRVAVVASAGNSFAGFNGQQGLAYPASDPNVIAVGAVYDRAAGAYSYGSGARADVSAPDIIAPFSQRTTAIPMVFAPGAPIAGAAGSGSGLTVMHGTSQAAPQVAGTVALMQQLSQQVLGRRMTFDELRTSLIMPGRVITDGDDERDNVTNTNAQFHRLSVSGTMNRIVRMSPTGQPEVAVTHAGVELHSEQGIVTRGSAAPGTPIIRTFVVRNDGRTAMSIGSLAVVGSAFSIERNVQSSVVQPGSSTTFRVLFIAPATGTFTARVSFTTNDPDERAFSFTLAMGASPQAAIDIVRAGAFPDVLTWKI